MLKDEDKKLKDIAKIDRKMTEDDEDVDQTDDIREIINLIEYIIEDFDEGFGDISRSLQPHIGSEDIILTFGYSKLALACFQEAKEGEK